MIIKQVLVLHEDRECITGLNPQRNSQPVLRDGVLKLTFRTSGGHIHPDPPSNLTHLDFSACLPEIHDIFIRSFRKQPANQGSLSSDWLTKLWLLELKGEPKRDVKLHRGAFWSLNSQMNHLKSKVNSVIMLIIDMQSSHCKKRLYICVFVLLRQGE